MFGITLTSQLFIRTGGQFYGDLKSDYKLPSELSVYVFWLAKLMMLALLSAQFIIV